MSVSDFYYEFREAEYEPGLTKLKTKRFPTGAAGTPNDVKWGNNDNVWFTGAANCVGRFDNARKLTIFPRKVGHMPTLMSRDQHPLNFEYGWRFLDPVSRRIGFIDQFGKYHEELELEPGLTPTMFGPGKGLFQCGLVATDAGIVVDLVQNKRFQMRTPKVDAIGLALDSLWQISDSRLTCFAPGYSTGGRSLTLEGGYSKPGCMVAGRPNTYLIYMDPGRDVIGFIEGYDKVLEVKLPAGTGIRAMHVSTDMTIWFTGKGGKSLFQLDRKRTVIEYPCVTDSDLLHIDSGSQCLWFTEPKHNCVTFADISTL
jgi:streptogramin lyase